VKGETLNKTLQGKKPTSFKHRSAFSRKNPYKKPFFVFSPKTFMEKNLLI
jgi:hypothetical protein